MLDRHLTEQGAAEVLGWSINRVVARVKILRLPERAQQMVGAGAIPLSAIDQLLSIGRVKPKPCARKRVRVMPWLTNQREPSRAAPHG